MNRLPRRCPVRQWAKISFTVRESDSQQCVPLAAAEVYRPQTPKSCKREQRALANLPPSGFRTGAQHSLNDLGSLDIPQLDLLISRRGSNLPRIPREAGGKDTSRVHRIAVEQGALLPSCRAVIEEDLTVAPGAREK